jgi:hypothetical protein
LALAVSLALKVMSGLGATLWMTAAKSSAPEKPNGNHAAKPRSAREIEGRKEFTATAKALNR